MEVSLFHSPHVQNLRVVLFQIYSMNSSDLFRLEPVLTTSGTSKNCEKTPDAKTKKLHISCVI